MSGPRRSRTQAGAQAGAQTGTPARTLVYAAILGALLVVLIWLQRPRGWETEVAGQPLPSIDSELFFLKVPELVKRGPARLAVLRLGRRCRLVPHQVSQAPMTKGGAPVPMAIEAWQALLGAPVVFNGGQYDADWQYLGLLKSRGSWLSAQRKGPFMGLLVSDPLSQRAALHGPQTRILDLAVPPWHDLPMQSIVDGYHNVMQSMMLLDAEAQVRVRRSERAACRTVVAEDRAGRLLLLFTEGAVTLHELARWLMQSDLQVVRAMNLDGGQESQLVVRTQELNLTLYGQYGQGAGPSVHVPLPTVISLEMAPKEAPGVAP